MDHNNVTNLLVKNSIMESLIDNRLIEMRFPFNEIEQKLFLYSLYILGKTNFMTNILNLSLPQLKEAMDMKDRSAKYIEALLDRMMDQKIYFRTADGEINKFIAFYSLTYKEDLSGTIKIKFNEDLLQYCKGLVKNYTTLDLKILFSMSGRYSTKFYMMVRKDLYKLMKRQPIEYSIHELYGLRWQLGIQDNEYSTFRAFNQRVLTPMLAEIKKKSGLDLQVEKIKQGKTVTDLKFTLTEASIRRVRVIHAEEERQKKETENEKIEENRQELNNFEYESKNYKERVRKERQSGLSGNHYAVRQEFASDLEFYKFVTFLKEERFEKIIYPYGDEELFNKLDKRYKVQQ